MNGKRIFEILTTILLIAAVVLFASVIACCSEHECVGEGCRFCAVVTSVQQLLRALGSAVSAAALFGSAGVGFILGISRLAILRGISPTPVSLSVKLTN